MKKKIQEYRISICGINVYVYGLGTEVYGVSFEEDTSTKNRLRTICDITDGDIGDPIFTEFQRYSILGVINNLTPKFPWGTEFQKAVWKEISRIPAGQTSTYGAIARNIGKPRAARAVGRAAGANPIPILVPCHRVLGNGCIGGYSPGKKIKKSLLIHEDILTLKKK